MSRPGDGAADRVLVLTPFGRDAEMVCERLEAAGLGCEVCGDLGALLAAIAESPPGAVLIAREALSPQGAEDLLAALDEQEPWSDLPVLLLTEEASTSVAGTRAVAGMFERANVTILERPVRVQLLVSTLRAALRSRLRQFQTRDLMRELQRAVQLSDLFVSILGHDLRTPLGAIKLSAEAIVRHPETSALRAAGRILGSTDRMTRMIEQLLDFARVRQGRGIPVRPRTADLGEVCRAVVEELGYAHPQARILVEANGALAGEWDPDRLAQVVSNLVANAVQHGAGGTPVVVELDGTEQDLVRVRVHNLGSMPAAVLPTLFEAFGDAPTPRAGPARSGLGLGLFIAREITRAHGGDIAVRSAEPEGTTFEVVLPRRSLEREAPGMASRAADSPTGPAATH